MSSKLITVITAVASVLLVAQVAAADQVQEQLRLMEQRMAEMEDRLQATSEELRTAQTTVDEQQNMLTESGLIEAEDSGIRSGVGDFMEMVDVSGVLAASFNYRLHESDVNGDLAGGNSYFGYPNSNTFQMDQFWLTMDKSPTDESRGGFHVDLAAGSMAEAQGASGDDTPFVYSGYVSYLAPVGNGIQVDAGKLPTPLGAEVIQAGGTYFVTIGNVFGLQPVVSTGVVASTQITDEIGFLFGVVNDVYSDTMVAQAQDKAYYGQFQYSGDMFNLNVGGIIGQDAAACAAGQSAGCQTSVVDVVLSADPTENLSVWANFDWVHSGGQGTDNHGDAMGISVAGRLGISETMGVASRVEYVWAEDSLVDNTTAGTDDSEVVSLTTTLDKTLAEGLVAKLELRWDTQLDDNSANRFADGRNDQVVAIAQMYYQF